MLCNGCARGKARRKRINKEDLAKATRPGQRLQMDLSGPFHKTSTGSRYWMKVICQYSRKCWDYFLKKKNEVRETIEHLIDILEAGGWKVEYIRCNNAGEHLEVKVMLEKRGIEIEFTGAKTLERNGVVER